jgi:hypothetical protein
MSILPSLTCPRCRAALEYHVTIEMLSPAIGKLDTGYCVACARLFECIRETGTYYDSTLWPPVCRRCRQPVAYVRVDTAGLEVAATRDVERLVYECREHSDEQWTLTRGTDRWTRA